MENSELMLIVEQIERDKGIDKEILIEAIESAVASAAKKLWTVDKDEEVVVKLDRKSGKLLVMAGDEEIRSGEFGRIAAQTAKQVVIQKIREAEKNVIYEEYKQKVGQIISGTVYRFERGNMVVDLGKTEAIMPREEQSHKEEFKQGDRIRALVLEIDREQKGPQIKLSRSSKSFVRRLFEMEVPEIYEGIVEIKAIARSVGDRTKISVTSKDDKVDCVGACVGMRGSRVKNIVNELQGEKLDIVRYSDDIKEYIQAALSPAEISQIQINYIDKIANIIVAEDQLSLAIGRQGQNVRLASELVGWELDIYSVDQWKQLQKQQAEVEGGEKSGKEESEEVSEENAEAASSAKESAEEATEESVEEAEEEKSG